MTSGIEIRGVMPPPIHIPAASGLEEQIAVLGATATKATSPGCEGFASG
jgi:hypothetical protein